MNGRKQIEEYLNFILAGKKHLGITGKPYCGVEDFLLKHGKWMDPAPLDTTRYRRGAPKACFGNAVLLAAVHGIRYVEGLIPVHHAWNLDLQDRMIDNTWDGRVTPVAYLGVEFSVGRAMTAIWDDDGCVLDNPHDRFRIFRTEWKGEDYTKIWPMDAQLRKLVKRLRPSIPCG